MKNRKKRLLKPRKKTICLFFFLFLIVLLVIYHLIKPKIYHNKYQVNKYQIKETYDTKKDLYEITINVNNINYLYKRIDKKYEHANITKIKTYQKDNITCIKPTSRLNLEVICYEDNNIISPNLLDNEFKKEIGYQEPKEKSNKHQKITTYNLLNKNYYLWNYHGFTLIKKNNSFKEIRLFKNDTYDATLLTKLDNYILIADYDNQYYFKKFIVYDMKKNKESKISVNKEISFNSEILGNNNKSVYLLDKKNEREYEIVPEYLKYRLLKTPVYYNQGLKETTIKKLINEEVVWLNDYLITYFIMDNNLYMKYNDLAIRVSDLKIDKINYQDNLGVYYLVGDTLYHFDPNNLETKVLSYSEWQFNKNNNIIIY
ncbi:MAG: hypothetical protein J5892_00375 [Bacilli bacterium]|nr:hypothetical protein [Bacilli bacterium]